MAPGSKAPDRTITDLLAPRASLPPRINVKGVYVVAVGKPVPADAAKGKGKGAKGAGKGVKGKGKPTMSKQSLRVSIYVLEPDTGLVMWLNWQGDNMAVTNLLHANINIMNAKPSIAKEVVHLELDESSSIMHLLRDHDSTDILDFDYSHMALCAQTDVTTLSVGSYLNMALYLEVVDEKQTSSGDTYLQVSMQDTTGQRGTLQLYDHSTADFRQGDTILALGLVARAGRNFTGGQWVDDPTWCQARYSAYRTAIAKVHSLVNC